jgi:GntR family transcriptional regulator, transcriptional repressor for pyruvate dehydrogenase complex
MDKELFEASARQPSAVDMVVDRITSLLMAGDLKPGDLLPSEAALAEGLKVSRGPIREAMKVLQAIGLVEIRRGDGTYMQTTVDEKAFLPLLTKILIEGTDYAELIELRSFMERGIAAVIIGRGDQADLSQLGEAYERMVSSHASGDRTERDRADLEFHRVLGHLSGNTMISTIYDFVIRLFAPTIDALYGLEVHGALVEAFHRRDLAQVLELLDRHTEIWRTSNGLNDARGK